MKISEITNYLESLAPLSHQENYDNSGLIIGDPNAEVKSALISLDCTEEIVDEAIAKGYGLIISHHPIVFSGLKKLNGKTYVERTVIKAIKNDIALYAIHTNLDNYNLGVNHKIAELLQLKDVKVLSPKENTLLKLAFYVPNKNKTEVLNALFEAGAGNIGNYSECSFSSKGEGTFKPENGADPFIGKVGELSRDEEVKVEVILPTHHRNSVTNSLMNSHPYEEVAHEFTALLNTNQDIGSGMIGELENGCDEVAFLQKIKDTFQCGIIRHTALQNKPIKRVAVCGGAGGFLLNLAKKNKADIFITADYKYHEFFDAENQIVIADIGHFESEQYTTNLLGDILTKKFPKFAVHLTGINTNPIKYF
ncbi:MAG: dinuclear metal center YbgI/SA1388 family protein [Psychromonas sp.]|jgi:dinuclear metal center YbgI/SA1388 family protein